MGSSLLFSIVDLWLAIFSSQRPPRPSPWIVPRRFFDSTQTRFGWPLAPPGWRNRHPRRRFDPSPPFRWVAAQAQNGAPNPLSLANRSSRKSEKRPIGPCLNFQESVITAVGADPFARDVSLLPQRRP